MRDSSASEIWKNTKCIGGDALQHVKSFASPIYYYLRTPRSQKSLISLSLSFSGVHMHTVTLLPFSYWEICQANFLIFTHNGRHTLFSSLANSSHVSQLTVQWNSASSYAHSRHSCSLHNVLTKLTTFHCTEETQLHGHSPSLSFLLYTRSHL